MSVDRLCVLSSGIRYRDVVTLRRAKITVTIMWVLSIVGASSYFWNPVITLWYMCIGLSLCLVIPTYSYTKIFLSLHHNQVQVQGYGSEGQPSQPTEQSSIQKSSVQCTVGTGSIGRLFHAVWYNTCFDTSDWDVFIGLPCQAICVYFSLLQLVVKPVALLPEDQRSKKGCKGYH